MRALTVTLLLAPIPAFAYFDPGTGSLLIQALIAGMAAVVVFWGQVKAYLRSMFSRNKGESPAGDDKPDAVNGDNADPPEDANQQ